MSSFDAFNSNKLGSMRHVHFELVLISFSSLVVRLVEGGQRVLLLERGPERDKSTDNVNTLQDAVFGPCVETFSSGGVVAATGNCLGGATTYNQGIWILETPQWLRERIAEVSGEVFFDDDTIMEAFQWVTER